MARGTSVTGLSTGASSIEASGSSEMAVPGISSGSSSISVGVEAVDDIGVCGVDSYSGSESDESRRMMGRDITEIILVSNVFMKSMQCNAYDHVYIPTVIV